MAKAPGTETGSDAPKGIRPNPFQDTGSRNLVSEAEPLSSAGAAPLFLAFGAAAAAVPVAARQFEDDPRQGPVASAAGNAEPVAPGPVPSVDPVGPAEGALPDETFEGILPSPVPAPSAGAGAALPGPSVPASSFPATAPQATSFPTVPDAPPPFDEAVHTAPDTGATSTSAQPAEEAPRDPEAAAPPLPDTAPANEATVSAPVETDPARNAISEHAAPGTATGLTVQAHDTDVSDTVTYAVDDPRFTIGADGAVRVAPGATFDAETEATVTLTVTATSADGSESRQAFDIAIDDVNEATVSAPVETDPARNAISEHAAPGTATGLTVQAHDTDVSDTVTYAVDDPRFTIGADGAVRVAPGATFDAETEATVTLTVTATSADGSESRQAFDIAIDDVNEATVSAPVETDPARNAISEHAAPGTATGLTVQVHDADVSDTVTYAVDDSRFTIGADGAVRVAPGATFDAETEATVTLTVTATSADGSESRQAFDIAIDDVNEATVSAPVETDPARNAISEHAAPGTATGLTVQAHDADVSDTVTYAVDDPRFTIGADGAVRVAPGATFDAETEATVTLTVTATSADGSESRQAFDIAIDDVNEATVSAPVETDPARNAISEHAAPGTATGLTVQAHDTDVSDTVTYAVDDPRFTIGADGAVRVAPGATFDAETEATVTLTVTATSADGSESRQAFDIAIDDVNEATVSAPVETDPARNAISEHAAPGTATGLTVQAHDADATLNRITYSLEDSRFTIDAEGAIHVAPGATFDAETEGVVDLAVTAHSEDGSQATTIFRIDLLDVNEFDIGPLRDADGVHNGVGEHAEIGSRTGIIANAVDADASARVTYTLTDNADGRFAVDADTGVVTVAGELDYEAQTSHDISILATSSDGTTSRQEFTIDVLDAADDMTFSFDFRALSNPDWRTSHEQDFGQVWASGSSVDFSWSMVDDHGGFFVVNPETGVYGLDYSKMPSLQPHYDLLFRATGENGAEYIAEVIQVFIGNWYGNTFRGTDTDGVFYAAEGNDTVYAGGGHDSTVGLAGNDRLYGQAGHDRIAGGTEADFIDGGTGIDEALYTASAQGVTVDLATGQGWGGEAEGDILVNIENLAGSRYADTLIGDADANRLMGMEGDDLLRGGAGADELIGGLGSDTADYSTSTSSVIVDLSTGQGSGGDAEGDRLSGIENLYGSSQADTLVGDANSNILTGEAGDDVIEGREGDDRIYGGEGADTLDGDAGNDTLIGGTGDDKLIGWLGDDFLDGGDGNDVVDGSIGDDTLIGGSGNDTILGWMGADSIEGGDGDDRIDAGTDGRFAEQDGNDTVFGGDGNDTIRGGYGDDRMAGGRGADMLHGGDGSDTFLYAPGDGTDTIEGGAGTSWIDAISLEGAGAPAGSESTGTGWTLYLDGDHEIIGQTEESMLLAQDSSGHIIFGDGSEIHFSGIEEVRF